jgi:hypothetical protein
MKLHTFTQQRKHDLALLPMTIYTASHIQSKQIYLVMKFT